MREYELKVDEAIFNGLSPMDNTPFNVPYLEECLGFICGRGALEAYQPLSLPEGMPGSFNFSWPFPQVVANKSCTIVAIRDSTHHYYYEINSDFSLTSIGAVPNTGWLIEVADFGLYVFFTDGSYMFYLSPSTGMWNALTPNTTVPLMKTICNLNGQAIGGNVSNWHGCDETFYVWSKIGSFDFTPDNDNEAGFRRCLYGGTISHVRKLGNAVVGYSSEGLTKLNPVSDPAPTIGFREVIDIGILNPGAMNGDERQHLYVGADRRLRMINLEGQISELGYKRYIDRLEGNVIVNYDKVQKHFYISDGQTTFLFTHQGMTEIPQHPSAVWSGNRVTYAIAPAIEPHRPYILTNAYDMNYKGLKTVMTVESDISHIDDPQANVVYYQDSHNIFETLNFPTNDQGITTVIISGSAFKLNVNFSEISPETKVSYIKARYKMTDLRGVRGVYAPPIRGQENAK